MSALHKLTHAPKSTPLFTRGANVDLTMIQEEEVEVLLNRYPQKPIGCGTVLLGSLCKNGQWQDWKNFGLFQGTLMNH